MHSFYCLVVCHCMTILYFLSIHLLVDIWIVSRSWTWYINQLLTFLTGDSVSEPSLNHTGSSSTCVQQGRLDNSQLHPSFSSFWIVTGSWCHLSLHPFLMILLTAPFLSAGTFLNESTCNAETSSSCLVELWITWQQGLEGLCHYQECLGSVWMLGHLWGLLQGLSGYSFVSLSLVE